MPHRGGDAHTLLARWKLFFNLESNNGSSRQIEAALGQLPATWTSLRFRSFLADVGQPPKIALLIHSDLLNALSFDLPASYYDARASLGTSRGSTHRTTMSSTAPLEVDGGAVAASASPAAELAPSFFKSPIGWYAVKSVQRPRLVFATAWAVIILLCAAGAPQFKQTETTNYDWLLGQNKVVSRSYALSKMQEETSTYTRLAERSVPQSDQLLHFMYQAQDSDQNLLKPAILKEILSVEKTYFMDSKFATYCAAKVADSTTCAASATQTLLNYFYDISVVRDANNETIANVSVLLDANGDAFIDTEAGIATKLASVMADADLGPIAALFFDTGFSAVNLKAKFVQSFYFLGLPLQGYANPSVQPETQRKPGNEYIIEMSETLKKKFGMKVRPWGFHQIPSLRLFAWTRLTLSFIYPYRKGDVLGKRVSKRSDHVHDGREFQNVLVVHPRARKRVAGAFGQRPGVDLALLHRRRGVRRVPHREHHHQRGVHAHDGVFHLRGVFFLPRAFPSHVFPVHQLPHHLRGAWNRGG